jgi:hypothetical protein
MNLCPFIVPGFRRLRSHSHLTLVRRSAGAGRVAPKSRTERSWRHEVARGRKRSMYPAPNRSGRPARRRDAVERDRKHSRTAERKCTGPSSRSATSRPSRCPLASRPHAHAYKGSPRREGRWPLEPRSGVSRGPALKTVSSRVRGRGSHSERVAQSFGVTFRSPSAGPRLRDQRSGSCR